jgi:hypothetical protein
MLVRRRQLLAAFRQCLWQSRPARLYLHTHRRLQRCPVGSALDRDATGLSRGTLINTRCGLIGIARHLRLTSSDNDRGRIGAARRRRLASGNARRDFVDASRYQLLTGDDPVEAWPHPVEFIQHRIKLPVIGVWVGWPSQRDCVGSFLDSCLPWGQPAKLRIRACDHLSRRVPIRLPDQGGSYTDAKRNQATGEGAPGFAEWRGLSVRERIIFEGGRANWRWLG